MDMTSPPQKLSWTQPICAECFENANPGRTPICVVNAGTDKCCLCGAETTAGIFIRRDPTTVTFPAYEEV